MNIYVGNLPFSASEDDVRDLFTQHGQVMSVKLINDRETGRPRGFGFVMMSAGGDQAVEGLKEDVVDGGGVGGNRH